MYTLFTCPDCGETFSVQWDVNDEVDCECGARWLLAVDEGSDGSIYLSAFSRVERQQLVSEG